MLVTRNDLGIIGTSLWREVLEHCPSCTDMFPDFNFDFINFWLPEYREYLTDAHTMGEERWSPPKV